MGLQGTGCFLQCYLMLAAAMYFELGEQEEKCIIEEIPENTLVTGELVTWKSPPECRLCSQLQQKMSQILNVYANCQLL